MFFMCTLFAKKIWSQKPKQNSSGRFGLQFDPSFSPKALWPAHVMTL